jgi:hypothetical protein
MFIKNKTLISWSIIFFLNVTNVEVVKHSVQSHCFWYCQAELCAVVRVSSQLYPSSHSRVTYLPAGLFLRVQPPCFCCFERVIKNYSHLLALFCVIYDKWADIAVLKLKISERHLYRHQQKGDARIVTVLIHMLGHAAGSAVG